MKKLRNGFTLMELLVVVAILAILMVAVLMNLRGQVARGLDHRRKTDLYLLSKSFEEYYNDKSGFPDVTVVTNCGSPLGQYAQKIPCDPETKAPYGYFPSASGGYRLCAKLSDTTDPAIVSMGCNGPQGCGVGAGYNYCLGSGVTASAVGTVDQTDFIPGPGGEGTTPTPDEGGGGGGTLTPTPTPDLNPAYHVTCSSGGACVWFSVPTQHGCLVSWEFDCPGYIHSPETPFSGACGVVGNRCIE